MVSFNFRGVRKATQSTLWPGHFPAQIAIDIPQ